MDWCSTRSQTNADTVERLHLHLGRELSRHRSFCIQNSVRNLFDVRNTKLDVLLTELGGTTTIQAITNVLQSKRSDLKFLVVREKGVQRLKILDYLANLKSGKFLLPAGSHCIAIDADNGLILESHPEYPSISKLSLESFT